MAKKGNSQGAKQVNQIGWPQAFRDMVIASMNKGQLPLFAMAFIVFTLVFRMERKDVSALVFRIMDRLESGHLVGWALFLMVVAGWFWHARLMRKSFSEEFERIGAEKAELQGKAAGAQFQGSQPHRRR